MLRKILMVLGSVVFLFSVLGEGEAKGEDMLILVVPPITSVKILPDTPLLSIPGVISDEIKVVATPGEYEPASFVVAALSDLTLLAEATDLKGKEGVIPSQNIDIRIVKRWFQAASAWVSIAPVGKERVLVPELLLNNPFLVKVDFERQENYLELSFPEGKRFVWISNPDEKVIKRYRPGSILCVEDFPVKDSPYLLPVNIPAGTNQQFWITIKVPDTAPAGIYTGSITLSTEKETLATLTLKLRVLPFKLSPPKTHHNLEQDFISSIYYRGRLNPDYPRGSISAWWKSKEQLKAELKTMFAHGITNPICDQGLRWLGDTLDRELLREHLRIRYEVGMGGQPLFYLGLEFEFPSPDKVKEILELVKPFGITEVYFAGSCEAQGEELKAQRPAWEAARKAGGKVFVASYVRGENFELMGDIQDLLVAAKAPSREEAAKWHSVGHRIVSYDNPQTGPENPEVFRRNFGLSLWKANYDGAMTYAFHSGLNNIWNDFDGTALRDLNFTYPTVDGVITTIALAGYREGIDDIRYATTLRLKIEKARKSRNRGKRKAALRAESYLRELDLDRNLDTIRLEIINHILKLMEE